jgi:bicarbonate transport system permease protein
MAPSVSRRSTNSFAKTVEKLLPEIVPPLLAILAFLAVWQLLVWVLPTQLPGPIQVVKEANILILYPFYDLGGLDKGLGWQVLASLQRVAMGYGLAAIVGIGAGLFLGCNPVFNKACDPIIQLLRTVPPLAWVPISLAALQKNEPAALFVIFITAIWPILINTIVGVQQIPQDYTNVAQVLRLRKKSYFTKILLPASLPYIFTGLRIGIGLAWLAIIAAEIVMSGIVGIGFFIWNSYTNGLVSEVIVALVYIGLVGLALDRLIGWVQTLIAPES